MNIFVFINSMKSVKEVCELLTSCGNVDVLMVSAVMQCDT